MIWNVGEFCYANHQHRGSEWKDIQPPKPEVRRRAISEAAFAVRPVQKPLFVLRENPPLQDETVEALGLESLMTWSVHEASVLRDAKLREQCKIRRSQRQA